MWYYQLLLSLCSWTVHYIANLIWCIFMTTEGCKNDNLLRIACAVNLRHICSHVKMQEMSYVWHYQYWFFLLKSDTSPGCNNYSLSMSWYYLIGCPGIIFIWYVSYLFWVIAKCLNLNVDISEHSTLCSIPNVVWYLTQTWTKHKYWTRNLATWWKCSGLL